MKQGFTHFVAPGHMRPGHFIEMFLLASFKVKYFFQNPQQPEFALATAYLVHYLCILTIILAILLESKWKKKVSFSTSANQMLISLLIS